MKAGVNTQIAGADSLGHEIRTGLASGKYTNFSFAVAFARWSGLALIDSELQSFAGQKGNTVNCVVGVDLGGTTAEALEYLLKLPSTTVSVLRSGNPRIIFHPKVYTFEGKSEWMWLIGSGNLTSGGLHSNIEVAVKASGTVRERNMAKDLFAQLEQARPPLNSTHVRKLDEALLKELAVELDSFAKPPPDSGKTGVWPTEALQLVEPLPPIGRPPVPAPLVKEKSPARSGKPKPLAAPTGAGTLYLELWRETGGGSEVQIPQPVLRNFFGAAEGSLTWLTLTSPSGSVVKVSLAEYANSTFRVQLGGLGVLPPRLAGVSKRGVLRFRRTGPDAYTVTVAAVGAKSYAAWRRKCVSRSTSASKGYGIT